MKLTVPEFPLSCRPSLSNVKGRPKINFSILFILVLTASIGYAADQDSIVGKTTQSFENVPVILSGTWVLNIENLRHDVITTMNIRFSKDQASSCMSGDWRKINVDSHSTNDEQFFPIDQPLSYKLDDKKLVIGCNEICDAYLHLDGEFVKLKANGVYVAFGFKGSKQIGYFTLVRGSE